MPVLASFVHQLGIHIGNWLQHQSSRAGPASQPFRRQFQTNQSFVRSNQSSWSPYRLPNPSSTSRDSSQRDESSAKRPERVSTTRRPKSDPICSQQLNQECLRIRSFHHIHIYILLKVCSTPELRNPRHRPKRRGSQHIPEKQEFALLMNRQVHCVPIFHNPEIREMHARICTGLEETIVVIFGELLYHREMMRQKQVLAPCILSVSTPVAGSQYIRQ